MALVIAAAPVRTAMAQAASAAPDEMKECRDRALERISRDDAAIIITFAGMLLAFETMCPRPMNRVGERAYWLARDAIRLCASRYVEWKCAPEMLELQFGGGYRDTERMLSSAAAGRRSEMCANFDDSDLSKLAAKLEAGVGPFAAMLRSIEQNPDSLKQRCERSWLDDQTPDRK